MCPTNLQPSNTLKKRWSTHKSHIRCAQQTCNLATHCIIEHSDLMVGDDKLRNTEDVKQILEFTILDRALDGTEETFVRLEEKWRNKLKSWEPHGLNSRNDGPKELRRKHLL